MSNRLFETPGVSFLIFASPKSGTTWLQRLLSSHPDVLCAESRAFGDYFAPNTVSQPHLTLEKYTLILSRYYAPAVNGLTPADGTFYRDLLFNTIDTFAATSRLATGKRVYGEKLTPYRDTAAHVAEMVRQYHPDIRFVNLVRDGRDVIVSGAVQWLNLRLLQAPVDQRAALQDTLERRIIPAAEFDLFLAHWTDAAEAGLRARQQFPYYLDARYERFLTDPRGSVTDLFRFIGVDASADTVSRCVESASFKSMSGGRETGEEDRRSFFRKGAAGDWADWFTGAQRDEFARRAGHLMTLTGYHGD
jgi:hypothetical protein